MSTLKRVLVVGSGPIVVGQAAEFDYAGTQATMGFHDEGVEVVGLNDNPATSLTRPGVADIAVIASVDQEHIIAAMHDHACTAVAAAFGGQAALNACVSLVDSGRLRSDQLLGTPRHGIEAAENRQAFAALAELLHAPTADSFSITCENQIERAIGVVGLPCLLRTSYTLGGTGTQLLHTIADVRNATITALATSGSAPTLERSLLGWCEVEFEVIRDCHGTAIAVCSMENLDPVGIHTGDSIVVAPIMTLDDALVQDLRRAALQLAHVIGVVGACNVQFAVNQLTREWHTIECNPRTSRSSALASKATAYPIARIAARLMCGSALSSIVLGSSGAPAALEPSMDYVTVKIPAWSDERFANVNVALGTQMRSTGESMGIGASFPEALGKAARGARLTQACAKFSSPGTLLAIDQAVCRGDSVSSIAVACGWQPWFIEEIARSIAAKAACANLTPKTLLAAKRLGVSDIAIAMVAGVTQTVIRQLRWKHGIIPGYRTIDGTAGELASAANYMYSTYASADAPRFGSNTVLIIGSGPIMIGQGVEFDCCTASALTRLRDLGISSAVLNCNPETVSTDYDASDALVFDPVDAEALDDIVRATGCSVIAQLGGQTAIDAATDSITVSDSQQITIAKNAGDRVIFDATCVTMGIIRPEIGVTDAPAILRPSHVIGGAGMRIVLNDDALAAAIANSATTLVIERLVDGVEFDVDVIRCNSGQTWTPGAIEQLDAPGVHSGDSIAVWPALSERKALAAETAALEIVRGMGCVGISNVQVIVSADLTAYVIEVNARASRTAPFVSKAAGIDIVAASIDAIELGCIPTMTLQRDRRWVKVPVWSKQLPAPALGPTMTSTGESMFSVPSSLGLLDLRLIARLGNSHPAPRQPA